MPKYVDDSNSEDLIFRQETNDDDKQQVRVNNAGLKLNDEWDDQMIADKLEELCTSGYDRESVKRYLEKLEFQVLSSQDSRFKNIIKFSGWNWVKNLGLLILSTQSTKHDKAIHDSIENCINLICSMSSPKEIFIPCLEILQCVSRSTALIDLKICVLRIVLNTLYQVLCQIKRDSPNVYHKFYEQVVSVLVELLLVNQTDCHVLDHNESSTLFALTSSWLIKMAKLNNLAAYDRNLRKNSNDIDSLFFSATFACLSVISIALANLDSEKIITAHITDDFDELIKLTGIKAFELIEYEQSLKQPALPKLGICVGLLRLSSSIPWAFSPRWLLSSLLKYFQPVFQDPGNEVLIQLGVDLIDLILNRTCVCMLEFDEMFSSDQELQHWIQSIIFCMSQCPNPELRYNLFLRFERVLHLFDVKSRFHVHFSLLTDNPYENYPTASLIILKNQVKLSMEFHDPKKIDFYSSHHLMDKVREVYFNQTKLFVQDLLQERSIDSKISHVSSYLNQLTSFLCWLIINEQKQDSNISGILNDINLEAIQRDHIDFITNHLEKISRVNMDICNCIDLVNFSLQTLQQKILLK